MLSYKKPLASEYVHKTSLKSNSPLDLNQRFSCTTHACQKHADHSLTQKANVLSRASAESIHPVVSQMTTDLDFSACDTFASVLRTDNAFIDVQNILLQEKFKQCLR